MKLNNTLLNGDSIIKEIKKKFFQKIPNDVGGSSVYVLLSLVNKETALAFYRTAA